MTIESVIFKKTKVNLEKLLCFGFFKCNDLYRFETEFMQKTFRAEIIVDKKGNVSGRVIDTESGEPYYPLRTLNPTGAYVCSVIDEYKKILTRIKNECFTENRFLFPQTERTANYVLKTYGDNPLYLWEDTPDCCVFKNPVTKKWYGIIMTIDKSKIDKTKKGEAEVMNVKLSPEKIQNLLKENGYYPAWHMNKKSWITVILDGTVNDKNIFELINESHNYTIKAK